jgi:hypothetical protein
MSRIASPTCAAFGSKRVTGPGSRTSGTGPVYGTELHAICIERRRSRRSAMWQLVAPTKHQKQDYAGRWQIQFFSGHFLRGR